MPVRAMRFKLVAATLLLAHLLTHPGLHGLPTIQGRRTVIKAPVLPGKHSPAAPGVPCLGCLVQRQLGSDALRATWAAPFAAQEFLFVDSQPSLRVPEGSFLLTRAPPSF